MTPQDTGAPPRPELSPAKLALRQARLRGEKRAAPILPRAGDGAAPLSFAQERLWFLHRLQPGSTLYHLPAALRITGGADEALLERTLGEVVRRHGPLRTTFREVDGVPEQVVAPFAGFTLPVDDLSALDPAAHEGEVARIAAAEVAAGFDLERGPLFRARLLRLGGGAHVLLLCAHHIVSDGWSGGVLLDELWALYAAYREGRPYPLAELPVQYADFAAWQREPAQEAAQARQLEYWKSQLAGAPELLELPADHPRPPVPSFRGGAVPVRVPVEVVDRLRELARGEGATLHMAVLAAFQALLGRYAGTDDVCVGTPVAGRARSEVEGLIGLFVNTLVLRTDLSGGPGFRALLRRVRETALGAYAHQHVPFERVVAALKPERSRSHAPLFQVMFTLENAEPSGGHGDGLGAEPLPVQARTTGFDLSLSVTAGAGGLSGGLEYAVDLFDPATAERMARRLERVLAQAAGDPDRRVSRLALMDADERARVLAAGRGDAAHDAEPVHRRFAAQAARTPDAPAVRYGSRWLSYAELNARANRLARRLRALSVAPERRVGVCCARTPELVVALLGTWKAGGAFVPLDPAYPAGRLAVMARDAGVRVLLADASAGGAPWAGVEVVPLDADPDGDEGEGLDLEVDLGNAAYVIYTSGTTGRPKGVVVTHGSLARLLAAAREAFRPGPGDVMPSLAPYAFDIWLFETLLPLTSGAAVRMVPRERLLDLAALGEETADATFLHAVPALMRELARAELAAPARPRLRRIFVGGDRVPPDLLAAMRAAFPSARAHVLYGPTEGTILASAHAVDTDGAVRAHPIGRPLGSARLYVCDAWGEVQPMGVPGELWIGGAGVARGYLGRPGLTVERFVPDPFGDAPGARLYRTGDRARWRSDGTLEYLGRLDRQVKVRGHRVEPGEVEAALRRQPGVRDCAVVPREDATGDRRLVAYVVGGGEGEALRARLAAELPEPMLPAAFVRVERLPLSPNGKLDLAALPAPAARAEAAEPAEPRDFLEVQLIQLWEALLGVRGIGPTQGFFELGGNSLLALRLFAEVRRRLGCDLPVSTLFERATVRAMADAVRERRARPSAAEPVVALQPHGALPPLFLVHSTGRGLTCYVSLVRHLGAEQPAYGIPDLGDDLGRPLERIAAEHVAAVRSVQPRGPYFLCGWSYGGLVAFEMALQLERAGETVAFVGLLDAVAPGLLERLPWDRDAESLVALAELYAKRAGAEFSLDAEALAGMAPDERVRRVVDEMHAQGVAPPGFGADDVHAERGLMADRLRSHAGYAPGRFSGTLTLFRAADVTRAHDPFFATLSDEERRTYGWHHLARGVEVHPVPGSHTLIASEPYVQEFARVLRESLRTARACAERGPGCDTRG
ncbi:MAG TPA: amino acid adenylation domain-containing protein [Longimicrobium sp.]|nr:amino acid adenylation domain-containing protein [Longimicrobium sp.]